jgi:hypothetical protein
MAPQSRIEFGYVPPKNVEAVMEGLKEKALAESRARWWAENRDKEHRVKTAEREKEAQRQRMEAEKMERIQAYQRKNPGQAGNVKAGRHWDKWHEALNANYAAENWLAPWVEGMMRQGFRLRAEGKRLAPDDFRTLGERSIMLRNIRGDERQEIEKRLGKWSERSGAPDALNVVLSHALEKIRSQKK